MRHKFVLASLLISGAAYAQDAEPDPNAPPTDGTGGGGGEMGGGEMNASGEMSVSPEVMGTAGMWPRSASARPFFRAKGKATAGLDFNLLKASSSDAMGNTFSATLDFITLQAAYGVTDQISVGLLYALSLGLGDGDFEAVGPLSLWGGYQIKHDAKMSLAATGAFAIDLDNTDTKGIGLGLGFRYSVADKIAVFTGAPYGPGPVGGAGFGGGPLAGLFGGGGHLNISLADMGPITFDLPVGGMFQATPELAVHLMTNLASISISNSDTIIFGADYIPLIVGGLYSANEQIDVLASLNLPDLKEAQFDLFVISVGARIHL